MKRAEDEDDAKRQVMHWNISVSQWVVSIVQLVSEHDNIASQAKHTGIKPESLDDSCRLAIVLIVTCGAVVLDVHHVAQGQAYLEDERDGDEALEVGWHCEHEDDRHDHGRQHVVQELVERSELEMVAAILVPRIGMHFIVLIDIIAIQRSR